MSHHCIGVVLGHYTEEQIRHIKQTIKKVCRTNNRYVFFGMPSYHEPLFDYFIKHQYEFIAFRIADSKKYDNIEDMFRTCTENGECWDEFRLHCLQLQNTRSRLLKRVFYKKDMMLFIGESGCLFEEYEQIVIRASDISQVLYDRAAMNGYWYPGDCLLLIVQNK